MSKLEKETDFHNDLYQAKDWNDGSKVSYICVSYQPFLLRSVKTQDEYMKAQAMFEETQKCSNPSLWSDPAIQAKPHTRGLTSTQISDEPEAKFELPMISK